MKILRWVCIAVVVTTLTVLGACSDSESSRGGRGHNQRYTYKVTGTCLKVRLLGKSLRLGSQELT
jgi:hypothetical protein